MKSKKILLVDYEPDITESFGIALEDSGFDVVNKRETLINIQNGCE